MPHAVGLCHNGGHSRAKASVSTETAPEKPDASTQTKVVRKVVSVQVISFSGCTGTSEEKAGTCTKCVQVAE